MNSLRSRRLEVVGERENGGAGGRHANKRLIYKQFVQILALCLVSVCGPQFLSYLPKRFTHLCRVLYGEAILVDNEFGPPIYMAAGNQQKHLEFTFSTTALPFHSRARMRADKHIF